MCILSRISIVLFSCSGATALSSFLIATRARPNLMRAYPTSFLRRFAPSLHHRRPHDTFSSRRMRSANTSARGMATPERPDSEVPRSSEEEEDVCVRILCLHGKGGEGGQFIDRSLKPLRSLVDERLANSFDGQVACKMSARWECVTAPYELDPDDDSGGYSWWTMPSGVRSYNAREVRKMNQIAFRSSFFSLFRAGCETDRALFRRPTAHLDLTKKYEGFGESEAMVMDRIFPKANEIDTTCAFDVILGHSQGAILIAALLSLREELRSVSGPSGYILNGCAWPNPYSDSLMSIGTDRQRSGTFDLLPRIILVMGKNDSINPIDSAMRVHDACRAAGFDVSVVNHGGGHSVPVGGDEDSERALGEVVDWIIGIAKQKASQLTNHV